MSKYRHHRRAAAVALLVALAASACSGGARKESATGVSPSEAPTTTTTAPPTFPLTGLPVHDATAANRPALWVKIDNAPEARPQAGLEKADVVFEEVVEGGITRFLAVFQSQGSDPVGPVRSVRPIDPEIASPLGGLFAYSGGAPKFVAMLHQAPVRDVGATANGGDYFRTKRAAPHNQYSNTSALWKRAKLDTDAPPPLFAFLGTGDRFGGTLGEAITGLTVKLSVRSTADWAWDPASSQWKRSSDGRPHLSEAGGQLGFDNVIVQLTAYRNTGDVDVAHEPVPVADIVGSGDAWVLSQGRLVKARWSKTSASAVTTYADATGAPILLTPGRTFVEITPTTATLTPRPVTPATVPGSATTTTR